MFSKVLIVVAILFFFIAVLISSAIGTNAWAYSAALLEDKFLFVELNMGVMTFDLLQTDTRTGTVNTNSDKTYGDSTQLERKAKEAGFVTLAFGLLAFLSALASAGFTLVFFRGNILAGKLAMMGAVVCAFLLGAECAANPVLKGDHDDIVAFVRKVVGADIEVPRKIIAELGSAFAMNFFTTCLCVGGLFVLAIEVFMEERQKKKEQEEKQRRREKEAAAAEAGAVFTPRKGKASAKVAPEPISPVVEDEETTSLVSSEAVPPSTATPGDRVFVRSPRSAHIVRVEEDIHSPGGSSRYASVMGSPTDGDLYDHDQERLQMSRAFDPTAITEVEDLDGPSH
jgi:hypothetical protein